MTRQPRASALVVPHIVRMTLKQIASLGRELTPFLALFVGCFRSRPGIALLTVSVKGLLSDEQRKNAEAIALRFGKAPRTLRRFLQSICWDEALLRDECQRWCVVWRKKNGDWTIMRLAVGAACIATST